MQELFGAMMPALPPPEVLSSIFRMDVFEAARRRAISSFNPANTTDSDHEPQTLPA
jgi:hypothetical protein